MTKKLAHQILKAIESLGYVFGEIGIPGEIAFLSPTPEPAQEILDRLSARMQFWAGELAQDPPPPPVRKQVAIAVEIYEDLLSLYEEALEAQLAKEARAQKRKTPPPQGTSKGEPSTAQASTVLNPCWEVRPNPWSVN